MQNRVIYSDNGTLKDLSVQVNNYFNGTSQLNLKTTDYLYIGSRLPFNHVYLKFSEHNTVNTSLSVEYWSSEGWANCVEALDQTNGFMNDGHIEFTPNRQTSWAMESTNDEGESVDGLESVTIYSKYWIRIKPSANMADCVIQWIGNIFSDDFDLSAEYPDLVRSEVLSSFKVGKLNWEEQHVKAAELLISDLIDKNIIKDKGQILNWRDFTSASIQKAAEIIFNSFGDDYRDNSADARKEYNARISKRIYKVDLNKNGIEDVKESFNSSGFLSR